MGDSAPSGSAGSAPRVLIGAAGTATSFGIARTLRTTWPSEVEIVVADLKPRSLVAAAVFADDYLQSPAVADPGYADWLAGAWRRPGPASMCR